MLSAVSQLTGILPNSPRKNEIDLPEDKELARHYEEALAAHRRRRQIELKCAEMQEFMEDHG